MSSTLRARYCLLKQAIRLECARNQGEFMQPKLLSLVPRQKSQDFGHRGAGRDPPFPSPVPRASSVCLALLLMALLSFRHTHSQIEFLLSLGSFYRFCRCRNRVLWHNALLNHFVLPVRPCLPSVPPCFPVVLQPLNPRPGAADLDSDLDKDATAA